MVYYQDSTREGTVFFFIAHALHFLYAATLFGYFGCEWQV